MWETKATRTTNASKESIWKHWSDVASWSDWDKDIEYSKLFGDFKTGSKGILKPVGAPKTRFTMLTCDYLKGFHDRSSLPLCKLDFIHSMHEVNGKIEVEHIVRISGLLTFLFSRIIGKKIQSGLPHAVENLVVLAEQDIRKNV